MNVYAMAYGLKLSCVDNQLYVHRNEEKIATYPITAITAVNISTQTQITSQYIERLMKRMIKAVQKVINKSFDVVKVYRFRENLKTEIFGQMPELCREKFVVL